ncbi:MAG TPA: CAP domain-containing protein [Candidatus Saccharimonadales bacterium]|nr:CAP domain-containing protein [Candidatus Saccharimonadales bacterium]
MTFVNQPKRNSSHHKKRAGQHHRHSDHYLKTYWPYLPMLLIVGLGLIVNSLWSHQNVLGASSDFSNSALLTDTNAQRSASHENGLALNNQLSAAAQAKANDMVQHNYWAHTSPDGKTPWSFITTAGYHYQMAGENLAYGFSNAGDTVAGWMNSPTHRANILNANYKDVGFGVAQSPDYQGQGPATIIVAEYGEPAEAAPVTSGGTAGVQDTQLAAAKSQPVSRIQLLTNGQATWSSVAVAAIAGAAVALFLLRNGLRLKRLVLEGESFVLHHPMLDITLVFAGTMAFIFAQASGTIH